MATAIGGAWVASEARAQTPGARATLLPDKIGTPVVSPDGTRTTLDDPPPHRFFGGKVGFNTVATTQ